MVLCVFSVFLCETKLLHRVTLRRHRETQRVHTATITVTTENLPAGVMAKTTGRIDTLFVHEKQEVKQGDLLAVIENAARFEDILELKMALDTLMAVYLSKVKNFYHKVHKDFSQSSQRTVLHNFIFVSFKSRIKKVMKYEQSLCNSVSPLWYSV